MVAAAEGSEAMDLLRHPAFSPCLILLGLMMPGMNGWDFLQLRGHQALPEELVVFDQEDVVHGIGPGRDQCKGGTTPPGTADEAPHRRTSSNLLWIVSFRYITTGLRQSVR